jgi:hypothetical protein
MGVRRSLVVSAHLPGTAAPLHSLDVLQELLLRKTWRPTLSVIGAAGLPSLEQVRK